MKRIMLYLLILTFLLSGCDAGYSRTSAGASSYDYALSVIQESVPYVSGMDLRLDSIKLLETDKYGRNLFLYEMGSSSVSVLLIVQKTTESLVYYYEDQSYMIEKTEAKDFCGDDKDTIKLWNDWDKPLDESRMMAIDYTISPADHENIPDYLEACKLVQRDMEHLYPEKEWDNAEISLNGLESYEGCGQVILAEIYYSDVDTMEYYLILYYPTQECVIREVVAISGIDSFKEQIKSFKDLYCR